MADPSTGSRVCGSGKWGEEGGVSRWQGGTRTARKLGCLACGDSAHRNGGRFYTVTYTHPRSVKFLPLRALLLYGETSAP